MNVPGLKVAVQPRRRRDGLLPPRSGRKIRCSSSSTRCLYATRGEVPDDADYAAPFGCCVRREGRDVTLVAIGGMLLAAMQAAETLAAEGIEIEIG